MTEDDTFRVLARTTFFEKIKKIALKKIVDMDTIEQADAFLRKYGWTVNELEIIKGNKMLIFIDTEFTDLVPGNKLISIALVDENEEFFYAELTDTYELKDCSEFVKSFVLPFLFGGDYRMSSYDCALKLGNWIEDRNEDCILACDNPDWDMPHLRNLLSNCWPENLHKNQYHPVYVPSHIGEDIVLENNYNIHNALHDALVMKKSADLQKILKF